MRKTTMAASDRRMWARRTSHSTAGWRTMEMNRATAIQVKTFCSLRKISSRARVTTTEATAAMMVRTGTPAEPRTRSAGPVDDGVGIEGKVTHLQVFRGSPVATAAEG